MGRIYGIHEYKLKPSVDEGEFERAIREAERRRLFDLPGLLEHHFLKHAKGERRGQYAALWVFESRAAWERLWGRPEQPLPKRDYPLRWRIWEDEILAPILAGDPDRIPFADYEEL